MINHDQEPEEWLFTRCIHCGTQLNHRSAVIHSGACVTEEAIYGWRICWVCYNVEYGYISSSEGRDGDCGATSARPGGIYDPDWIQPFWKRIT